MIAIPGTSANLALVRVEYAEGDPDIYVMPGSIAIGEAADKLLAEAPDLIFARIQAGDGQMGVLYSAVWDRQFAEVLLGSMTKRRQIRGRSGELIGSHTRAFRGIWGPDRPVLKSSVLRADQRNTSIAFGDRFVLKLFRRIEPGVNPEIEISTFLAENGFRNTPQVGGSLEYRSASGESMSLGILHAFVPNQGSAWHFTLDSLGRFFEHALTQAEPLPPIPLMPLPAAIPEAVSDLMGEYAEAARLMGRRTGEMHVVLASGTSPAFAPEAFTDHYRQGLYHGFITDANRALVSLREALPGLAPATQLEAQSVLDRAEVIRAGFRPIRDQRFETQRIRIHGDLNLRQILYCGKDFSLIDFEGLPSRSYGERSIKRSPLRDVAGMLRSLHYAAYAVLFGLVPGISPRAESVAAFDAWAAFWASWAGAFFLDGYLSEASKGGFLPSDEKDVHALLQAYVLSKALSETATELNDRPEWAIIPLRGISSILQGRNSG